MMKTVLKSALLIWIGCLTAFQTMGQSPGSEEVLQGTIGVTAGATRASGSESLFIGPGTYQVDGTWDIYSKNVWISPVAVISGTGSIRFHNPEVAGGVVGATFIDGNNSAYLDVNIQIQNELGLRISDIATASLPDDLQSAWTNTEGNATVKVGKDLLLAVDGADVWLSTAAVGDLSFNTNATFSGYRASRMVVTGNSIVIHVVKTGYTGDFIFPVGIADGDYTPVKVANTDVNTIHVSVQDYAASTSVESSTGGIERSWNIFADNATGNSIVSLQHNVGTEQSGFNTSSNFVTRWSGSAPNTTGNSGTPSTSAWQSNALTTPVKTPATESFTTDPAGMTDFSIVNLAVTSFGTTSAAEISYLSKASNLGSPLGTIDTPDLRPFTTMLTPTFTSAATTRAFSVRVRNMRDGTTAEEPVIIRVYKPTSSATVVLTGASATGWTITNSGLYYTLTTNTDIPAGAAGNVITANLTIPATAASGDYQFRVFIPDLSGGEVLSDNGNNNVYIQVIKN